MKKLVALVSVPLLALSLAACSGNEGASKEEVQKGLEKTFNSAFGGLVDEKLVGDYVTCIVDKSYDSLSAAGRDALAEGVTLENADDLKLPEKDDELMSKSADECEDVLMSAFE